MRHFVRLLQEDSKQRELISAAISVQSHLMAFAAEQSRLEKRSINMKEFSNTFQQSDVSV